MIYSYDLGQCHKGYSMAQTAWHAVRSAAGILLELGGNFAGK